MVFNIILEGASNIDKGLALLTENNQLVVSVSTIAVLLFNIILNGIRNKGIKIDSMDLKKQYTNVAKVVDDTLVQVINKVNEFTDIIDELIKSNNDKDKQAEEFKKLVILALQTANVPIIEKQAFYKALNEKDELGIELAAKSLNQAISKELDDVKVDNKELDNATNILNEL